MAGRGWSIKEAGAVLGVHPKKVPQALDPALRKVALLFRADPQKTLLDLLDAMLRLPPSEPEHSDAILLHTRSGTPLPNGTPSRLT